MVAAAVIIGDLYITALYPYPLAGFLPTSKHIISAAGHPLGGIS